jgi:hypothetical protein
MPGNIAHQSKAILMQRRDQALANSGGLRSDWQGSERNLKAEHQAAQALLDANRDWLLRERYQRITFLKNWLAKYSVPFYHEVLPMEQADIDWRVNELAFLRASLQTELAA